MSTEEFFSPRGEHEPIESWVIRHRGESNRAYSKSLEDRERLLKDVETLKERVLTLEKESTAEKERRKTAMAVIKWTAYLVALAWAILLWGKEHIKW